MPSEPRAVSWPAKAAAARASPSPRAQIEVCRILFMAVASSVQIDQPADVDREQELGQISGVGEEVVVQAGEVPARGVEVVAQVRHLAQEVEGVPGRADVAERLGEVQGGEPLPPGVLVAAGLQVGETEVEPRRDLVPAGAEAAQQAQALVEQPVPLGIAALEDAAVAQVVEDLAAGRAGLRGEQL